MFARSSRELIAALRARVDEAERELQALEGRPLQALWSEIRNAPLTPPEPQLSEEAAPEPEPAVPLAASLGLMKLELGDAAGAELALRLALTRAIACGAAAQTLPRLIALTTVALAESGRGDVVDAWLDALAEQIDHLDDGDARADGRVWEAWSCLHLGRLGRAEQAALAARSGSGDDEPAAVASITAARARLVAASCAIVKGAPGEALALVDGLGAQPALDDERVTRVDAVAVEALAHAMRGDAARATAEVQHAEALAGGATSLRLHDRVDAVFAWVLLHQGQPAQARTLAQRAQRGLPPAPTLDRALPALIEAEACLASAAALPDIAGAQMAGLLQEGRRLVERLLRATLPMTDLHAQARRIGGELDALFGLHLTARALVDLEALAGDGASAASALEQARALAAVAHVRGRLGNPEASRWRDQAIARANDAGAVALAKRLERRVHLAESTFNARESIASGARSRELELLLEVGRAISAMLELSPLLERIMDALIELVDGERGFLMLYDEPQARGGAAMSEAPLQVRVARNMAREDVLGADAQLSQSVVAEAKRTGEPLVVNDAGSDLRFADKASVMLLNLRSVICLPLRTNAHDFGVVYVENRSLSQIFGPRHLELVRPLTAQAALAIDNAFAYQRNQKLYEETLSVARARERILNHVSHELKTPIAIISGALKMLEKRLAGDDRSLKSVARAERNIRRLIDIQQHMLDIYEARHGDDSDAERAERVLLGPLVREVVDAALAQAGDRELELVIDVAADAVALVAPGALRSSLSGLFRNAVENTPDEGRVTVSVAADVPGLIAIEIADRGVGICAQNLPHIFEGFFHTQATERYSSRRPFEFDAGGKGLDLLRIRAIAECHGWDMTFESERCRFLPTDEDTCPGRVSACAHCTSVATCHDSGGTVVRLLVPSSRSIDDASEVG